MENHTKKWENTDSKLVASCDDQITAHFLE